MNNLKKLMKLKEVLQMGADWSRRYRSRYRTVSRTIVARCCNRWKTDWAPLWLIFLVLHVHSLASLGWVTPGAATEGVTPLFFFLKNLATFLSCQFCGVIPDFFLFLLRKTWRPFLLITLSLFIAFTRVSPPSRVSPHTFFTCPTSFLHYSL